MSLLNFLIFSRLLRSFYVNNHYVCYYRYFLPFYLIILARTSGTMLKRNTKSGPKCPIPNCKVI